MNTFVKTPESLLKDCGFENHRSRGKSCVLTIVGVLRGRYGYATASAYHGVQHILRKDFMLQVLVIFTQKQRRRCCRVSIFRAPFSVGGDFSICVLHVMCVHLRVTCKCVSKLLRLASFLHHLFFGICISRSNVITHDSHSAGWVFFSASLGH